MRDIGKEWLTAPHSAIFSEILRLNIITVSMLRTPKSRCEFAFARPPTPGRLLTNAHAGGFDSFRASGSRGRKLMPSKRERRRLPGGEAGFLLSLAAISSVPPLAATLQFSWVIGKLTHEDGYIAIRRERECPGPGHLAYWRRPRPAAEEIATVRLALDLGAALIDTAEMYGEGASRAGLWARRSRADATRCFW